MSDVLSVTGPVGVRVCYTQATHAWTFCFSSFCFLLFCVFVFVFVFCFVFIAKGSWSCLGVFTTKMSPVLSLLMLTLFRVSR